MASGGVVSIASMTVALAIAVVFLAAGLIYALLVRQPEPAQQPDLAPAIQERIEKQVQARGETDVQTRALLEQMGQTIGNLNSETAGLKKALRQPQTRG